MNNEDSTFLLDWLYTPRLDNSTDIFTWGYAPEDTNFWILVGGITLWMHSRTVCSAVVGAGLQARFRI